MEIVLVIAVILVIALVIGSMDNNRPVSDWSDEKLLRMHDKLNKAANAAFMAKDYNKSGEHQEKFKEVGEEIKRRQNAAFSQKSGKSASDLSQQEQMNLMQVAAQRSAALMQETMQNNKCTEPEAKKIIASKIDAITQDFIKQGHDPDSANERAIQKILGLGT
jgi:hypothetical protein